MNRKLKFRVWDKTKNEYSKPLEKKFQDLLNQIDDGMVLRRFTGLQDKNGKDIYDGDVLFQDGATEYQEVKQQTSGLWVAESQYLLDYVLNICSKSVVVSNIFESPELLIDNSK